MQRKTIVHLFKTSPFKNITNLIDNFQKKQPENYYYKPIGIELEITNVCNLRCDGCPIIVDDYKTEDTLSTKEYARILPECYDYGMFGYSITGGEPFLKFKTRKEILTSPHELDIYKLNTNGSFFKTKDITLQYLNELKQCGFGEKNNYIKAVIVISQKKES